jgi:hypothetical protein
MRKNRSGFAWGVILILLGALFLAKELFPGFSYVFEWPWIIIGVGLVFLFIAVLTRTGGLAIPGSIISGVGAILYYQNLTSYWGETAYLWALIPGFVGIGIAIAKIINPEENPGAWNASLILLMISAIAFFASGGSGMFGLTSQIILPVLVIIFGAFLLIRGILKK